MGKDFRNEDYEVRKKSTWGASPVSRASLDAILDDAPAYLKAGDDHGLLGGLSDLDHDQYLYKDYTVISEAVALGTYTKNKITGGINFGWTRTTSGNMYGLGGLDSLMPVLFAGDNTGNDTNSCLFIYGGLGGLHGDSTPHRGLRMFLGIYDNENGTKAMMIEKGGSGGYGLVVNMLSSCNNEASQGFAVTNAGTARASAIRMDLQGSDCKGLWSRQNNDYQMAVCIERVNVIKWWFTVLSNGTLKLYRGTTWNNKVERDSWAV